jgi:hypothetical protein
MFRDPINAENGKEHCRAYFVLCRLFQLVADQFEQWQKDQHDGNDRDWPSDWPVEKDQKVTVREQKRLP